MILYRVECWDDKWHLVCPENKVIDSDIEPHWLFSAALMLNLTKEDQNDS